MYPLELSADEYIFHSLALLNRRNSFTVDSKWNCCCNKKRVCITIILSTILIVVLIAVLTLIGIDS